MGFIASIARVVCLKIGYCADCNYNLNVTFFHSFIFYNNFISAFYVIICFLLYESSVCLGSIFSIMFSEMSSDCKPFASWIVTRSSNTNNTWIHIYRLSVEFVILFLSLQPQLLQIHLSPANWTIAIHFTLASHKQNSTNFNAFKIHWHVSLQILQNINTSHQHSKNYTGFLTNKELITHIAYKTLTDQQPTYLYSSLSFPSHSVSPLANISRLKTHIFKIAFPP